MFLLTHNSLMLSAVLEEKVGPIWVYLGVPDKVLTECK